MNYRIALILVASLWLSACGDDSTSEDNTTNTDTTASGADVSDTSGATDTSGTSGTTDTSGATTEDGVTTSDTSSSGTDTGPGTPGDPLSARVFERDPISDNDQLIDVLLPEPTSTDGSLTNAFAEVRNCLRERGETITVSGFAVGFLCAERATAFPNSFGNYLDHTFPADDMDPEDSFTEVQVYYHINLIHDFYKSTFTFDGMDLALPASTNMQAEINELAASFLGIPAGWTSFDNAAYIPAGTPLGDFGLTPRDEGMLMFLAGTAADLSYDASVIYHEYTHAVVGPNRLTGVIIDEYGLDNFPGAINEALADYFAVTVLDHPLEGPYLAKVSPTGPRDLSITRTCPQHITTEIHADGKVIGSAMWAIRELVGAAAADPIVFAALQSSSQGTSFEQFGQLVLANAQADLTAEQATAVEGILRDHGVIGCVRAKPWTAFNAQTTEEGVPYTVYGKQDIGGSGEWAPGIVQFYFDANPGEAVELSWTLGAGGGGLIGGGAPSPLDIAIRHGEPVTLNLAGPVSLNALTELDIPAPAGNSGEQAVTLSGNCLPPEAGRIYVMFLNRGAGSSLATMNIKTVADTNGARNLVTCD